MEAEIQEYEYLLRAVDLPGRRPDYWEPDGRISTAAFKDDRGLSVDRTGERSLEDSVEYASSHLRGVIASVAATDCQKVETKLFYKPSKSNPYHTEIHQSSTTIELSPIQALYLRDHCIIVRNPSIQFA